MGNVQDMCVNFIAVLIMMTSPNGNIFHVICHLYGEFTGHWWIPCTEASDAELWFFFDLRLNKQFSKQSWGWWFGTSSHPLWRHCSMFEAIHGTIPMYIIDDKLELEHEQFPFTSRIWNNVIQHLSYNIVNNFFNHKADRRPLKYHRYRRATTKSMYIKLLQFLIHIINDL